MRDNSFLAGWLYFWTTFTHSWTFVLGFAVATVVSALFWELLKVVAKTLWARL